MKRQLPALLVLLALTFSLVVEARGFRVFKSFTPEGDTPSTVKTTANTERAQVSRAAATDALVKVIALWNTPAMQEALSERLFDAEKFGDAVAENLPRDAVLRLQSVRGVQTLSRQQRQDPVSGVVENVQIVSVTAQTQLEFNSPTLGFVRRLGVNEFILEIAQTAP